MHEQEEYVAGASSTFHKAVQQTIKNSHPDKEQLNHPLYKNIRSTDHLQSHTNKLQSHLLHIKFQSMISHGIHYHSFQWLAPGPLCESSSIKNSLMCTNAPQSVDSIMKPQETVGSTFLLSNN